MHLGKVVGVNGGRQDNSLFIDSIVALTECKPVSGFHRLQVPVMANFFETAQTFSNGVLPMKLQYVPTTLRRIRAKTKNNHEITNTDVAIRTWITALGIFTRISHRPYWRSKVGTRLFNQIYMIHRTNVHQHRKDNQIAIDLTLPGIEQ